MILCALTQAQDESGGAPDISYGRLPLSTILYGGRNATKQEKAEKRETIKSFMNNAKEGDVYRLGNGFGTSGETFEIVHFNRSPNKLGIRSGSRTIALNSANATKFLTNGARLIKRR